MITEAVSTAKAIGAAANKILVRGDAAYCSDKVVVAVVTAGAVFSFTIGRNRAVEATVASIDEQAYTLVDYSQTLPGDILAAIYHNLLRAVTLTANHRMEEAATHWPRTWLRLWKAVFVT
jgi:hypothetical protein